MELVCMDNLTLEASKGGYQHILVITYHFTRFAMTIPTRNRLAKRTAEALFNRFIVHYGIPGRMNSDQGANFESKVIRKLCAITGMSKSRTTSCHAMGNGMCERFNRILLNMLGSLPLLKKANWKAYVNKLVHAYNCTRHESTGQTPYLLMFGRNPRLPVDVAFGPRENEPTTQYVADLRQRISKAYGFTAAPAEEARTKQRETYNTKVRGGIVRVGYRVLVKIVCFDGKHKLGDKWEQEPYTVTAQPTEDIPVFTVRKENGEGRTRTLHRNLFLPVGFVKDSPPTPAPRKTRTKYVTRTVCEEPTNTQHENSRESDSEYDSVWLPLMRLSLFRRLMERIKILALKGQKWRLLRRRFLKQQHLKQRQYR